MSTPSPVGALPSAAAPSPAPSSSVGAASVPVSGVSTMGLSSLPSSPSSASNEKTKRYDRQLRLWGDHGQHRLERARVCLVGGASAVGCETLKSLVLPGVGAFAVVDNKLVTKEDVGNNFFLDLDSIGQQRGAVATNLLLEMNNEVTGDFVEDTPENILENRPEFFRTFSLVVATGGLSEKTLKALSTLLWESGVPLMIVRAYGFVGYIRLQIREHTIVESHPESKFMDLRLDMPFPALLDYMDAQDMGAMTKQQHGHTPYLVILHKCLQRWKKEHGGKPPQNYREKTQFKQTIMDCRLRNEDGVPEEEENFEEACAAVNIGLHPTHIPSKVKKIFEDPCCDNLTKNSSDFWLIARAVRDFVSEKGGGHLPVSGVIPDMFSDSERYIQLQHVYRDKAAEDFAWVYKRVQELLESAGKPTETISESAVRLFCKESFHLRLVRTGSSVADEFDGRSPHRHDVARHLEERPDSPALYYFALRGVDRFRAEYNAVPGADGAETVEPDIGKLRACCARVLSECGLSATVSLRDDFVHEVCRVGGAELHAVAAMVGANAAQEAVKIITGQYVPVDNLFLYDGASSETLMLTV